MRLLWLADTLRSAGLTVHEVDGWRTRGSDSYGPVFGITCHETQGSWTSSDAGEINVLLNGSNSAPPPIAQLYLSRSGEWWVVASGTCFHNRVGTAGPNVGIGNDGLLGIEAQHGKDEPWGGVQYRSYVKGVAALAKAGGWPVERIAGHKEHQPGEKSDPGFDMDTFRRDVAAVLKGDNDMTALVRVRETGKVYMTTGTHYYWIPDPDRYRLVLKAWNGRLDPPQDINADELNAFGVDADAEGGPGSPVVLPTAAEIAAELIRQLASK